MTVPLEEEKEGLRTLRAFLARIRAHAGRDWQPVIWCAALAVGVLVAYATIGFRMAILGVQWLAFGSAQQNLATTAAALPWWTVAAMPVAGGIIVGALLYLGQRWHALPEGRPHGVADVIEAAGVHDSRVSGRTGFFSILISTLSLGMGASAGREGPAVHLGATLASLAARRMGYGPHAAQILLASGAAAAVSASFNAPIAGVLFALEVVLGHYALSVFGPVVIASVSAAVVARIHLGEFPAFAVPIMDFGSYWQMPAFALLGLASGVVAVVFMRTAIQINGLARDACARTGFPNWARPAAAGIVVGAIAVFLPQVLGVGYKATDIALRGGFALWLALLLIAAKIVATAVTLAGRFGGGVFSPALYLGAMTGSAFGLIATPLFPGEAGDIAVYAVVGMGAVAAAVLGAPISTALIAFELVREYGLALALLISVSISTVFTQAVLGKSYFHWQIERRGYRLREGPQDVLLQTILAREVMREETRTLDAAERDGPTALPGDPLKTVFELMDGHNTNVLPVVAAKGDAACIGTVERSRALAAYNRALVNAHIEQHR